MPLRERTIKGSLKISTGLSSSCFGGVFLQNLVNLEQQKCNIEKKSIII
jgi:hypothetical protein